MTVSIRLGNRNNEQPDLPDWWNYGRLRRRESWQRGPRLCWKAPRRLFHLPSNTRAHHKVPIPSARSLSATSQHSL